jgi:hypothetical protein
MPKNLIDFRVKNRAFEGAHPDIIRMTHGRLFIFPGASKLP